MLKTVHSVFRAGLAAFLALALAVPVFGAPASAFAVAPTDDEIPGVALPASPVVDSLDEITDSHDVYAVELTAGQSFSATLTADAGTNFDLHLFNDSATTVDDIDLWVDSGTVGNPCELTYTVATSGTYYLDVDAFGGVGAYTLTWETATAPTPSDDDIPGLALDGSPVSGSLDDVADPNDVFSLQLTAGDRLDVTVTYDEASFPEDGLVTYLFGPTAANIAGIPLAVVQPTRNQLTYFATEAGTYYLDLYAMYGAGDYQLTYSISRGELSDGDNDIPTARDLPASPVAGILGMTNLDDVFSVPLIPGQTFRMQFGSNEAAFLASLFGPDATSIVDLDKIVQESSGGALTYVADRDDNYFLDINSPDGTGGSYEFTWSVEHAPTRLTASRVVPEVDYDGGEVSVEATLTRSADGAALAGKTVTLEKDETEDAVGWLPVASYQTDADGAVTCTDKAVSKSKYRVVFAGDTDYAESNAEAGTTAPPEDVTTALTVTRDVPATVAWGGTAVVTARLAKSADGSPLGNMPLLLEKSEAGKGWTPVQTLQTLSDGTATFSTVPGMQTRYQVTFLGVNQFIGSGPMPAGTCTPKAYLTSPRTSSSYRLGTRIATYGYLKPRHAAGTKSVKIYAYRYERVRGTYKWVVRRTYYATNANYSSYTKYSLRFALPYRGRWKLVARVQGDTTHATTYSSGRYLTIK